MGRSHSLLEAGPGALRPVGCCTGPRRAAPRAPGSQACLERASTEKRRAKAGRGVVYVFLTLLPSCFPAPAPRPGFHPSLPAPVSPWVSGGGKAQVFAKLMTCLCAKRTGGWTSTQTPLMASRPLCWRPRSPALAPCRLRPRPTPMPAALAPRSTPEPPSAPLPAPLGSGEVWCPLRAHHNFAAFSLASHWGAAVGSLGTLAQGPPPPTRCQEHWGRGSRSPSCFQGGPPPEWSPLFMTLLACWAEGPFGPSSGPGGCPAT